MRLETGVVQRRSVDVVDAAYPRLFEDEEARHLDLVVVTRLQSSDFRAPREQTSHGSCSKEESQTLNALTNAKCAHIIGHSSHSSVGTS